MTFSVLVLAYVVIERLSELVISRRNMNRLLMRGAREVSPEHYPFIVALHVAWIAGLSVLAWDRPVHLAWLAVYVLLQAMRFWVVTTLGERWTTRIIVLPKAPLIRKGPYRFLNHPNYVVIVGEIAVLPLVFGLYWYALLFSVLNAILLVIRIRAENAALRNAAA